MSPRSPCCEHTRALAQAQYAGHLEAIDGAAELVGGYLQPGLRPARCASCASRAISRVWSASEAPGAHLLEGGPRRPPRCRPATRLRGLGDAIALALQARRLADRLLDGLERSCATVERISSSDACARCAEDHAVRRPLPPLAHQLHRARHFSPDGVHQRGDLPGRAGGALGNGASDRRRPPRQTAGRAHRPARR